LVRLVRRAAGETLFAQLIIIISAKAGRSANT